MQACFLLGPAGSGKTFRCLREIRAALHGAPEGPPLILLAPKQATFQLERQLLADPVLHGYTRLQILSFERFARFILDAMGAPLPSEGLDGEGCVMVLRALLLRHESELKRLRGSARSSGFAQELSGLFGEFQQHHLTPAGLHALAQRPGLRHELQDKLHDLALLYNAYANWLAEHELQDGNRLLDAAAEALGRNKKVEVRGSEPDVSLHPSSLVLHISQLWLDGFAEMTPQELDLLAAVLPFCERVTLAFCLDETGSKKVKSELSWLSIWAAVGKTYQQCRQRLANLPDCKVSVELLGRKSPNRFSNNPALKHLEQNWMQPAKYPETRSQKPEASIRIASCINADAEATLAAREILRFVSVRNGKRFRDCTVLVRDLDGYHKQLERAFRCYGIPYFLDRRESVTHHPLAELTRNALRTVAFDWAHDDWFAALKTGFLAVDETEIDRLENAALEFGWRGKKWCEPLPDEFSERLRKKILPPFENFAVQISKQKLQPTGTQLADCIRKLWDDLNVETTLERWSLTDSEQSAIGNLAPTRLSGSQSAIHQTVWDQMNAWLDDVVLAFQDEPLALRDWLPVLESGLANLTVGVIPPALDQVLIGAIDRARNPDLKLAIVIGMNESVFPAAPAAPVILTDTDREELGHAVALGPDLRDRLARERYYGYIALTRASERLVVTFARHDADGRALNPSPFIAQLQRIFPELEVVKFNGEVPLDEVEHISEIIVPLIEVQYLVGAEVTRLKSKESQNLLTSAATDENWRVLLALPALKSLVQSLVALREPDPAELLSPMLAEKLFGPTFRASVSRLEEFAGCPFKFFVHTGLHAEERKKFELDPRERGSFQHEVLKKFHVDLTKDGKRWRDLTPAEARERVGKIAADLMMDYRDGLLRDTAQSQFEARVLTGSLQDFIEVIVSWMHGQYEFEPAAAELDFGFDGSAPAWELDLGGGHKLALRGRIDRIDLCRDAPHKGDALAVVMDYKSGKEELDAVLIEHGVQLQLLAYLSVLRHWENPRKIFGVGKLIPAGVFYVNLRSQFGSGKTRNDVLDAADARKLVYRHNGRFDATALPKLDSTKAADQFNYRPNQDGTLRKNSVEALPRAEFEKLLDRVETLLRKMGNEIFCGAAKVDPYRKGQETPCEYCDYRAACRIDPWTHRYRLLRSVTA